MTKIYKGWFWLYHYIFIFRFSKQRKWLANMVIIIRNASSVLSAEDHWIIKLFAKVLHIYLSSIRRFTKNSIRHFSLEMLGLPKSLNRWKKSCFFYIMIRNLSLFSQLRIWYFHRTRQRSVLQELLCSRAWTQVQTNSSWCWCYSPPGKICRARPNQTFMM